MSLCHCRFSRLARHGTIALVALLLVSTASHVALGQDYRTSAVGGISCDANGIVSNSSIDATGKLREVLRQGLSAVPQELGQLAPMRKVSLRGLEEAIAQCNQAGKDLPDEIKYLAGLQQIRYVLVYPERQDIVLAGPGEGWKVDDRGNR
jgi:hypothetical protein